MPEPSELATRFAQRAKVVLFNVCAVTTLIELALLVPLRSNFTPIRLDVMNVPPDQIARFRPNLRDVEYVHEQAPGAVRGYRPIRISTNAEGFRDVDHAVARSPGVFRVAVFGDSFIFGLGLQQPDTLPSALQRDLGDRYELFNFGIPGMNFEGMGRMTQVFGMKYRPDVALYSFICDDVSTTDSVSVMRWSRTIQGLSSALPYVINEGVQRLFVNWKMALYTSDFRVISMVPPLYWHRIDLVLDYLHSLAARGGHEVMVVDYCRSWNFAYAVRRYDSGHGTRTQVIDDFRLEVNSNDGHPTAACNRAASARLTPALREARARREVAAARSPSRP